LTKRIQDFVKSQLNTKNTINQREEKTEEAFTSDQYLCP